MTRARRITQGERTHAERIVEQGEPIVASPEAKVGEPRLIPERMCKRCEKAAEPDTAYGVILAPSGLGHYWLDDDTTLCGADASSWPRPAHTPLEAIA